jgi:hypothetical protein
MLLRCKGPRPSLLPLRLQRTIVHFRGSTEGRADVDNCRINDIACLAVCCYLELATRLDQPKPFRLLHYHA